MMSPRKVRRVVSLIRGKSVEEALTILKFTNKAAAGPLAKTIQSATANALAVEGTSKLKAEDLAITTIQVDEGPRAKRIRFRAMGRVYRYKKPFSHVTVVVEGTPREEAPKKRAARKTAAAEDTRAATATAKEAGEIKTKATRRQTATPKKKATPKAAGRAGKKAPVGDDDTTADESKA